MNWIKDYNGCPNSSMSEAMSTIQSCPLCAQENIYPEGDNYVCADCGHEWHQNEAVSAENFADAEVRDAYGNVLSNGDSVVLVKDLKVKGSSTTLKMGTKVKGIRIAGGDHEVDCKMEGGTIC